MKLFNTICNDFITVEITIVVNKVIKSWYVIKSVLLPVNSYLQLL